MAGDDKDSARLDAAVEELIANCDRDTRAAVTELLALIRNLIHENRALRRTASPWVAKRRPTVTRPSPRVTAAAKSPGLSPLEGNLACHYFDETNGDSADLSTADRTL